MSLSLAIYTRHDANITLSDGTKVVWYLELEKWTGERYFAFSRQPEVFQAQWDQYVAPLLPSQSLEHLILCWVFPEQEQLIRSWFPETTSVIKPSHHLSHAASAYLFTDPRPDDLVLSYDGGGDLDDVFNLYRYDPEDRRFELLYSPPLNLGTPYRMLGILSPELADEKVFAYDSRLDLPGKIMGLAAYGEFVQEWRDAILTYFAGFHQIHSVEGASLQAGVDRFLGHIRRSNGYHWERIEARNLVRTTQAVFETIVLRELTPWVEALCPQRLVLVGGCALNVLANTRLATHFGLEVFVPPCPNDCGISLGASRLLFPQLTLLPDPFTTWTATNRTKTTLSGCISITAGPEDMAARLAEGSIIGVVRSGIEMGPRALGNRSLLASPAIPGMRDRLNSIKGREFFRPVAPMITADAYHEYFAKGPMSPFMSFAPLALPKAVACPEALHYDKTARVQTVTTNQEWTYSLLRTFGDLTGHPMLLNTSFNDKGKPLLNDVDTAINLFEETEMDGLLIENTLWMKEV